MPGDDFTFDLIRLPDRRSTFRSKLLHADDRRIVLTHQINPSKPMLVGGEPVMGPGYQAVWFLYKGESWDIGRFYRPETDGRYTWTGYYLDVLEPVWWDGSDPRTLRPLVDLFLDLWISPRGELLVLDEDELEAALKCGVVTPEQDKRARETLARLMLSVTSDEIPPAEVRDFCLKGKGAEPCA